MDDSQQAALKFTVSFCESFIRTRPIHQFGVGRIDPFSHLSAMDGFVTLRGSAPALAGAHGGAPLATRHTDVPRARVNQFGISRIDPFSQLSAME